MNNQIMVSIICNTYNHERYIEKVIQSFINQQTEFQFEILIHDDASTDGTAKIIKKYENEYPEIVKPIYQTQNQYSIDANNINRIQFSRVKGKYVAFCEGDDYWIDNQKLTKQVHALELHLELDLCVHSAKVFQFDREIKRIAPKNSNCIISIEEMIRGGGGYVATNSLMFRSECIKNSPSFLEIYPIDYAYQIYTATRGGALYLNEDMSVYNYMNSGSWSEKGIKNPEFVIQESEKCIKMLKGFDSYTNHIYKRAVQESILFFEFEILWRKGDMKEIMNSKEIYKSQSFGMKCRVRFRALFPKCYEWLRKQNIAFNSRNLLREFHKM